MDFNTFAAYLMRIYHALTIGDHHTNHCEDYLSICEIDPETLMCAVMDGCSMGKDSYFASTLTGKLLRKISKELSYKLFASKEKLELQQMLEKIVGQLFHELHLHKNSLNLHRNEILSTLLIGIIDTEKKSGEFLCIGDGLICVNQQFFEFEQSDKPDYLGYHLDEDFGDWYKNQRQRISSVGINDFSIATDGIFTFKKYDAKTYEQPGNVIDFLLVNAEDGEHENMLERKIFDLKNEWGLKPSDDCAIIRGIV